MWWGTKYIYKVAFSLLLIFTYLSSAGACSLSGFAGFSQNWLSANCVSPNWCEQSDLNYDGLVNSLDLPLFFEKWLFDAPINEIEWVSISKTGFTGEISRYEITTLQYCRYLNEAYIDGLLMVTATSYVYSYDDTDFSEPFFRTYQSDSSSPISFSNGVFSVLTRDGIDMSNHPVIFVSWQGAKAFCDYYDYYLPTENQWQAAADYDDNTYGCGDIINNTLANYNYENPTGFSSMPFTSAVNLYPSYGYGLNDISGNVWEWTDTVCPTNSSAMITKGGGWDVDWYYCNISGSRAVSSTSCCSAIGFRVCR